MALGDGKAAAVEAPDQVIDTEVTENTSVEQAVEQPVNGGAQVASPAAADAIRKRYEFWKGKLAEATSEAHVEAATDALVRIEKEAIAKGVNLKGGAAPDPTAVVGKGARVPRSVKEKNAAAAHKAGKLAEQAAQGKTNVAGAKVKAAPKEKKPKVLKPCLDGCGNLVPGNFQMGHDAKLKSVLLKIEKGELDLTSVPEIAAGIVKFKKGELETLKNSKGETTGKVQHMILLAAPVKFHGRPEVQFTQREA